MKGKSVCFIAGKYAGKTGWVNVAMEHGENTIPVIVNLGKKGEKVTYVYSDNLALEESYEPVVKQCPRHRKKSYSGLSASC